MLHGNNACILKILMGLTKFINPRVDLIGQPGLVLSVTFGNILRRLRDENGAGIKRLAPELGVTYTYLSKLENDVAVPSADFIDRVARHFGYNKDHLLLAAGKVPPDILEILRENPDAALQFLKERFGEKPNESERSS